MDKKREENVKIMIDILKDLEIIRIPLPGKNIQHAWYKLYAYLVSDNLSPNWNRKKS